MSFSRTEGLNTQIQLSFRDDARRFFAREFSKREECERKFILRHARKLVDTAPKSRDFLLMPMHVEEGLSPQYLSRVRQALESHPTLTMVIFLNGQREDSTEEQFQERREGQQSVLGNYFGDSAQMLVVSSFFNARPRIGNIRALLTEVVLLAALSLDVDNPLLIYNDADTIDVTPDYFDLILGSKKSNARYYVGTTLHGFGIGEAALKAEHLLPELTIFNIAQNAITALCRRGDANYEVRLWPDGANLIISGAAYCAVGGFDRTAISGEDDIIGRALHRYRPNIFPSAVWGLNEENIPDPIFSDVHLPQAILFTSPRRVLAALTQNHLGTEAWTRVPFDEIRGPRLVVKTLIEQYLLDKRRIQATDILTLREGKHSARDGTIQRVVRIIMDMGVYDFRLRDAKQMEDYINETGLCSQEVFRQLVAAPERRLDFQESPLLLSLSGGRIYQGGVIENYRR